MKLAPFLSNADVTVEINPKNEEHLFKEMLQSLSENVTRVDVDTILRDLMRREKESSTGIGKGLAIPHATVESLDKTYMAVATLLNPIPFKSIDKRPVSFVIMLLSPPNRADEHVALLARIARMFSKEFFIDIALKAKSKEELVGILMDEDERHVG